MRGDAQNSRLGLSSRTRDSRRWEKAVCAFHAWSECNCRSNCNSVLLSSSQRTRETENTRAGYEYAAALPESDMLAPTIEALTIRLNQHSEF